MPRTSVAVTARLLPHDGKAQPTHHEGTGDGAEARSEDIDAEFRGREQPREDDDVDEAERRREGVGRKVDRGCPNSMIQATRCSRSANPLSTERMSGTGVPENKAAENAT